jgi:manganese transport protein
VALFGPAFVASVAYVDPGNFATNIAAGAKYGYLLLWVVVAASLMAMVIQTLSAKLGIATGQNLPEICREHFSRRTSILLWIQAEVIAMATDLAEFLGAAIGFNLLIGTSLTLSCVLTAVIAFGLLSLQRYGYRPFEAAIAVFLGAIGLCYLIEIFYAHPSANGAAAGLVPSFSGSESVLLAVGILGATVMPHVIYLHSALTQNRVVPQNNAEAKRLYRYTRVDVVIAMSIAGVINMAMLVMAASVFYKSGITDVASLENAHETLKPILGGASATLFALALLASGLSSSTVGTLAGQVVMQGFIRRQIPLYVRRAITMAPALIVLGLGLPTTGSLVISQVVLSFGIPFALVPLTLLTRRRDIMGPLVNRRATTVAMSVITTVIIVLNLALLVVVFTS